MKFNHYTIIFAAGLFLTSCNNGSSSTTTSSPYNVSLLDNGTPVTLPLGYFSNTTNGQAMTTYPTSVTLSYDKNKKALSVQYINGNDLYVNDNQYTENNSAMWNQEVFEMFIAPGSATPESYVEIEINPNNALFSIYVSNPNGQGTENQATFFNAESEGMILNTTKDAANNTWSGSFTFPLSLAGNVTSTYRVNFYRVVTTQMPDTSTTWACTTASCLYLAWSPTYSGSAPAFHIPQYFGTLNIIPTQP